MLTLLLGTAVFHCSRLPGCPLQTSERRRCCIVVGRPVQILLPDKRWCYRVECILERRAAVVALLQDGVGLETRAWPLSVQAVLLARSPGDANQRWACCDGGANRRAVAAIGEELLRVSRSYRLIWGRNNCRLRFIRRGMQIEEVNT